MTDGEYWVLKCFVLQIRILENHQNGKDTHVRGVKIFARDERVTGPSIGANASGSGRASRVEREYIGDVEPEWMREPELR